MELQTNFDPTDVEKNKVMGILAYLSILCLVPIFAAKDSAWARFHGNQGLSLFVCSLVVWIVNMVLGGIPVVGLLLGIVAWLINIGILVLSIIGIINALKGEAKPLPLVGGLNFIQYISK